MGRSADVVASTTPARVDARLRAMQALQLRVSGATLQQVADALGYRTPGGVWSAITRLLHRQEREAADDYRAFHLARLERLLLGQWQQAISGNTKATDVCLRILQEIGRITGVGSPVGVAASATVAVPPGSDGPGVNWIPDDDWMRRYVVAFEVCRHHARARRRRARCHMGLSVAEPASPDAPARFPRLACGLIAGLRGGSRLRPLRSAHRGTPAFIPDDAWLRKYVTACEEVLEGHAPPPVGEQEMAES